MREVPRSNSIGDIAFFGGKTYSTVTQDIHQSEAMILIEKRIVEGENRWNPSAFFIEDNYNLDQNNNSTERYSFTLTHSGIF